MTLEALERYEPVIGLEVHTHLRTESKLFSPAPVAYGNAPNHDIHAIDLGLPGVLPVLNERVVELAIRLGLAIHATVNLRSVFARKNYFYPDLPKGYQISQYEAPVVSEGWIEIEVPGSAPSSAGAVIRRIGVTRAHLEEDAGRSIHDDAVTGGSGTLVDLNRSGVPLLEIVSEPELRSAAEAGAYLRVLRSILRTVGVSEADMEKGQFRCDANVSLRPVGTEPFGTRTELKNINSFRFVEAAIDAEIERQADLLDEGEPVIQATMAFDPATRRTRVLRVKENAEDYRYFPDPDLIPLVISAEQVERVRASMPELPDAKRERFVSEFDLSEHDARVLTEKPPLAGFFERIAEIRGPQNAKGAANWILRDLLQALGERDWELAEASLTPEALASLLQLIEDGRLTAKSARELFVTLVEEGGDPETLMAERGLEAVSEPGAIDEAVNEAIEANPQAVESYREGDEKSLNFLMGQVMKKTKGKANPGTTRQFLIEKLGR